MLYCRTRCKKQNLNYFLTLQVCNFHIFLRQSRTWNMLTLTVDIYYPSQRISSSVCLAVDYSEHDILPHVDNICRGILMEIHICEEAADK